MAGGSQLPVFQDDPTPGPGGSVLLHSHSQVPRYPHGYRDGRPPPMSDQSPEPFRRAMSSAIQPQTTPSVGRPSGFLAIMLRIS